MIDIGNKGLVHGPNTNSVARLKSERDIMLKGDKSLKSRGFHTRANAEYFKGNPTGNTRSESILF